jgi:hypothetical protein
MPLTRSLLAITALLPLAGTADAAVWVNDLRLTAGIGIAPDSASENYSNSPQPGQDGTYDYNSLSSNASGEVSFGYYGGYIRRYWGGWVWGAGIQYIGSTYQSPWNSGINLHLSDVGPFLQAGWGYAFDRWSHMEFTGFISGGSAVGGWVDGDTPNQVSKGDGSYFQGGVRLGFYWILERHLLLGVQGELSSMESDISVDNPNGSHSDVAIFSDGAAVQGVIGVHF